MLTSLAAFASETLERVGAPSSYANRLASSSLRAGYLMGQFGRTGWQRRYFVLKPTSLLYYFGSSGDEEPLGCLDVEAFSRVETTGLLEDGSVCVELIRGEGRSEVRFRLKCLEADEGELWYASLRNETYAELKSTTEILRKQRDEFAAEIHKLEESLAGSREEATRQKATAQQAVARYDYLAHRVAALHGVDEVDDELLSKVKARAEHAARAAERERLRADAATAAARAVAEKATAQAHQFQIERDDARKLVHTLKAEKRALRRALIKRTSNPPPPSESPAIVVPKVIDEDDDICWREEFKENLRRALLNTLQQEPVIEDAPPAKQQTRPDDTCAQNTADFAPPADEDLSAFLADDENDNVLRIEYISPKIGISFSLVNDRLVVAGITAEYDPGLPVPPVGAALTAINGQLLERDTETNMRTLKSASRPLVLEFEEPQSFDIVTPVDTSSVDDDQGDEQYDDGLLPAHDSSSSLASFFRDSHAASSVPKSFVQGLLGARTATSTSSALS